MKNREIKFRAWRGMDMIYQEDESSAAAAHFFNRVHGQHHIMQFTGLKDSLGKDICEGDVIEFDLNSEMENETDIGIVRFSKQGFWTSQDEDHFEEILAEELESFPTKVIGNIYQKP